MIPEIVDIEFSARCNLKCGFCFGPVDNRAVADLPTAFWLQVLEWIREAGAKGIVVSGGEPTIHRDIVLLLSRARDLGLSVVLSTHGQNRRGLLACAPHTNWIALPVDAVSEEKLRAMRGKVWSLADAAERIREVRAINPEVRIKLGTVATRLNCGEVPELATALVTSCADIDTWKVYQYTPRRKFAEREEEFTLSDPEFQSVQNVVHQRLVGAGFETIFSSRANREKAYLFVYPDGTLATPMVFGSSDDVTYGNLYKDGPGILKTVLDVNSANHLANYHATYPV